MAGETTRDGSEVNHGFNALEIFGLDKWARVRPRRKTHRETKVEHDS
jgi:hypothetical protein